MSKNNILLNDRFMYCIIVLNAVCIFIQECGIHHWWIDCVDALCTLVFTAEMVVKHKEYGVKGYWSDGWNRMDGLLVIISLPSLFAFLVPSLFSGLSSVLVLRLLRIFRFFRTFRIFPGFQKIAKNFGVAMKQCYAIFFSFLILIVVFALLGCALFGGMAPQYFGTPIDAMYSTFRLFTIEGWYEIPDAVSAASTPLWGHLAKIYFCFLLIIGGIIGMSLINSIFVDAMVSDNNDDIKKQLDAIQKKLNKNS